MSKLPSAVDVFGGCGGLTAGLKSAGFSVLGAIEFDRTATAIYRVNHPEVKLWRKDIRSVTVKAVKNRLSLRVGELDLLAGCPPCQGFSTVRSLNGSRLVKDKRNDLIYEFLRLALGLQPKVIMLENVPGLATDNRLTRFISSLVSAGYHVTYKILNAASYGVPQRRQRLILMASRTGPVKFAPKCRKMLTVRHAISSLPKPGKSGDALHDLPEARTPKVMRLIKSIPRDGGSRKDLPSSRQLRCHRRFNGFKDVYGRMAWSSVAPTLTTGCYNPSKGRFLHPRQDRAITMREAALLQSFSAKYKFPVEHGKSVIALHIGNAFPPEFARRHALAARRHLLSSKHKRK